MTWIIFIAITVILLFGFVVLFGAPFVPTLKSQQEQAFKLLDLKPGQTLIELGSGDGRMLIAAARRGIKVIGFEINPLLAAYSWLLTRRYRSLVRIKWANFWHQTLPQCDGIYVFLLNRYMDRLHTKITQENTNLVKVVSFAFPIPHKQPISEEKGLFLYIYRPKK